MEQTTNPVGKFLDPLAIIAQLEIAKGAVVADFGCGPGYFTFPFSEAIGKDGIVYSFDILPHILESVAGKAKFLGVNNIITKRANLENVSGTKLQDSSVDWVILKDILFQNQKKEQMIDESHRILKSGGNVLVIEWNSSETAIGPSQEMRIEKERLEKMFTDANFSIQKNIDAGAFHYAFVAKK